MSGDVFGYIIGAGGVCFAVYSYFTSGILADKTKIIEQGMEIKHLKEEVKDLKERMDDFDDWYNRGRNN